MRESGFLLLVEKLKLVKCLQVVSALAVDHTGSRVLSGSYDYSVRMYDFQGMNSRLQSFRQLEPFEGHQVRNLSWSPTADRFLCVSGSAQAKVFIYYRNRLFGFSLHRLYITLHM